MANEGKKFEEDFRVSAESFSDIDVTRHYDPVGRFAGVRNICDFTLYLQPSNFHLELKSTFENTLNFKSAISNTQWDGLREKIGKPGVFPGFLINYANHEEVYFIHMRTALLMKTMEFKKSIHIEEARERGVRLDSEKRRTRFNYDVKSFLRRIEAKKW